MRQLMISLDKKILDKDSAVARRMVEYGKANELFIIIPDKQTIKFDLSLTVHVQSTGGKNKVVHFLNLFKIGKQTIQQFNNSTIQQFITVQDPFFIGLIGVWLKKKTGVKLEVQIHGDFFGDYYKKQWFKVCLAKFVIKRADIIRVVGKRIKNSLLKLGIEANKIVVRPVPVDLEKIKNYIPKINLHQKYPNYGKIFLVLGRLDPVKNIAWLINVFREVVKNKKNWLLLIVGSGVEEQPLKLQVTRYKLHDNIKLENWNEDPISYIKTADCILFPSLSEGYGLVPMEVAITGTPIIMSNVGVANYELKPSDKVKILPIDDKVKWIESLVSFYN